MIRKNWKRFTSAEMGLHGLRAGLRSLWEDIDSNRRRSEKKAVKASKDYIPGNWAEIMQRVRDKNKEVRCSAERCVSHIYADRMSSRPLGWSSIGADKMSRLRLYERNGGDMLKLVRFR